MTKEYLIIYRSQSGISEGIRFAFLLSQDTVDLCGIPVLELQN